MSYGEMQRKEIETIREKTIKVKLSEADCDRLSRLCGEHDLTVSCLIENFIGDLVDGTYSNGSDERDLAEEWFQRCWFGMFPKETMLHHFLEHWIDVEDFLNLLDKIEDMKKELAVAEKEQIEEDIEYYREELADLEEEYHDRIEIFLKWHPDANLQEEIAAIRKWYEESRRLKAE